MSTYKPTYRNKIAWPDMSYYSPGGAYEQSQRAIDTAAADAVASGQKKLNSDMANALLAYSAAGLGVGLSGTRLYQLISSAGKPKPKYTKFGPGAKTLDDTEKLGADTILDQVGAAVASVPSFIQNKFPALPDMGRMTENQKALFTPALLGSTALSMYGGNRIMAALAEARRKEELDDMVDDAKADYRRALTGKRAAALDAAFDIYTEKRGAGSWAEWLANKTLDPVRAVGLLPAYTTAVLGTGALSAKMTYDWTRERGKDVALARARKARARISDSAPIYMDPEQLVAIKELANKRQNA